MANEMNLDRLEALLETMEPVDIRAQYSDALTANPDCEALLAQFERLDEDLAHLKTDAATPELQLAPETSLLPPSPVQPVRPPQRKRTPWTILALPLAAVVIAGLLWIANVQRSEFGVGSRHAVDDTAVVNQYDVPEEAMPSESISQDDVPAHSLNPEEKAETAESAPGSVADGAKKKARGAPNLERANLQTASATPTGKADALEADVAEPAQGLPVDKKDQDVIQRPEPAAADTAQAVPQRQQEAVPEVRLGYAPKIANPETESMDADQLADDVVLDQDEPRGLAGVPVNELQADRVPSEVSAQENTSFDEVERADQSRRRRDLNQALFYDERGVTVAQSAWLTAWMAAWNDPASAFPSQLFTSDGGPYAWPVLAPKPVPLAILGQQWQRQPRPEIRDMTVVAVGAKSLTLRVAFVNVVAPQDVRVVLVFENGLCASSVMP